MMSLKLLVKRVSGKRNRNAASIAMSISEIT